MPLCGSHAAERGAQASLPPPPDAPALPVAVLVPCVPPLPPWPPLPPTRSPLEPPLDRPSRSVARLHATGSAAATPIAQSQALDPGLRVWGTGARDIGYE